MFEVKAHCATSSSYAGVQRPLLADLQVPGTNGVLGQGAEEQKGETARLVSSFMQLPFVVFLSYTNAPLAMIK